MLNKETMTKKDFSDEIILAITNYSEKISPKDFQKMLKFGLEAKNTEDRYFSIYYFEDGNFKLTENAYHTIKGYLYAELTIPVLNEILDISETEDEYMEQLQLVLDTAFSKAKNNLEYSLHASLLKTYHGVINSTLAKLNKSGLLDNSNPYRNDSARIRKVLCYDEAMNQDFYFSSVHVNTHENEPIINGFQNYIERRLSQVLNASKVNKTPEEQVIETIDNYYKALSEKDKARIKRILAKNNNELAFKFGNSPFALKYNKGVLKYTPTVEKQTIFYQTPFGLWSVYAYDGPEITVTTHYTITGNPISEAVLISKKIATIFKLGITPVWIANKMYLKK